MEDWGALQCRARTGTSRGEEDGLRTSSFCASREERRRPVLGGGVRCVWWVGVGVCGVWVVVGGWRCGLLWVGG